MAALSEIEKLEARWAENPDGRYFAPLADAYRKAGRIDEALTIVTGGLAKHPDYLSAHIVFGRCLLEKKDDAAAGAAFERVLGLDPENIIALKSLAEIAERTGDTTSARRWLARLVNVDAMNAEAVDDLARLGGPLPEDGAEAPAEAAAPLSFMDLGEPEAAAAATAPMPALEEPYVPKTLERPAMKWSPPPPPPEPEPTTAAAAPNEPVPAIELEMPPAAAASTPEPEAREAAPPMELEHTAYEPPAPTAPVATPGDLVPFDDQLAWGAGERQSRAITPEAAAEVAAEAEAHHEKTTAAIEFMGAEPPPGRASESGPPPAGVAAAIAAEQEPPLPPREQPGWSGVKESSESPTIEMAPMRAPDREERPAEAAGDPAMTEAVDESAAGLPLIMPEDVTPADEMRRPSSKLVQMVSPEPEATGDSSGEVMVTETMGDLYLKQGFKDQAADVYRRLLSVRPDDAGLKAKLAALESPQAMSATALGQEAVGSWLKRIARAQLQTPAAAAAPAPPEPGPTPMDQAFSGAEPEPEPVPAASSQPVEVRDSVTGAPARPATDQYSLDQLFGSGSQPMPRTSAPPPSASGSHTLGASFDEFFGSAPKQETVRPREGAAGGRQSEDDLSAFNAWLHGLKR